MSPGSQARKGGRSPGNHEVEGSPHFDQWIEPEPPAVDREALYKVTYADVTSQLLEELFADHREEAHRPPVVRVTACSRCQEVHRYDDMFVKAVTFEPASRKRNPDKPRRRRLVALLCPTCMMGDRDFRRPVVPRADPKGD